MFLVTVASDDGETPVFLGEDRQKTDKWIEENCLKLRNKEMFVVTEMHLNGGPIGEARYYNALGQEIE